MSNVPFPIRFPAPNPKPHTAQSPPSTTSKILPLICPKTTPRSRPHLTALSDNDQGCNKTSQNNETHLLSKPSPPQNQLTHSQSTTPRPHKFPAVGAAPYIPVRHLRPHHGVAPPVTIRSAIPVFSAPPLPIPHTQPNQLPPQLRGLPPMCGVAPPVTIRQAVPVYSAPKAPMKPVGSLMPSKDEKGHAIPVVSTPEDFKCSIKPEEEGEI